VNLLRECGKAQKAQANDQPQVQAGKTKVVAWTRQT
jgi:hypothetical protein